MKTKLVLAALLAGMMLFTACENAQKTGADVAIKGAQTAYAAVADQANQYVPDQTKDVQTAIQSAKDAYDKGDYAAAFEASKALPDKVKALAAAALAKKDELTAKWKDLSGSLPEMVTTVQTKVDALTKSHKVPAGAADTLASIKQTWTDASTAFTSGQIPDAVAKASAAKDKLIQLETTLGIKPAA
ncbi:MAG: hypothetical protein WAM89_02890 [Terriglobales bacterium]